MRAPFDGEIKDGAVSVPPPPPPLGFTVSVRNVDAVWYPALMFTLVVEVTATVLMVKLALAAPAGTVTVEGTVATFGLLLESATVAPPEGAGPERLTVPVDGDPPVTVEGLSVSPVNTTVPGGSTVTVPVLV
jgi:hypothetical protein